MGRVRHSPSRRLLLKSALSGGVVAGALGAGPVLREAAAAVDAGAQKAMYAGATYPFAVRDPNVEMLGCLYDNIMPGRLGGVSFEPSMLLPSYYSDRPGLADAFARGRKSLIKAIEADGAKRLKGCARKPEKGRQLMAMAIITPDFDFQEKVADFKRISKLSGLGGLVVAGVKRDRGLTTGTGLSFALFGTLAYFASKEFEKKFDFTQDILFLRQNKDKAWCYLDPVTGEQVVLRDILN